MCRYRRILTVLCTAALVSGCGPLLWGPGYRLVHPETGAIGICNVPSSLPIMMGLAEIDALNGCVQALENAGFRLPAPYVVPTPIRPAGRS